jgi:hypothetical protein
MTAERVVGGTAIISKPQKGLESHDSLSILQMIEQYAKRTDEFEIPTQLLQRAVNVIDQEDEIRTFLRGYQQITQVDPARLLETIGMHIRGIHPKKRDAKALIYLWGDSSLDLFDLYTPVNHIFDGYRIAGIPRRIRSKDWRVILGFRPISEPTN